ncbi:hypothetical protein M3557_11085 [Bhargavaea ginsengi]|uniref:hypothetical protein n=1 Tax=Bhargavaea ginsengi TaxID=426757 RepID=UPI0020410D83|nr:hypothetical protein [Bhargavaea ginsengi]MCM3088462.1 hypothetical protein [Bhargavaea ginsengi]
MRKFFDEMMNDEKRCPSGIAFSFDRLIRRPMKIPMFMLRPGGSLVIHGLNFVIHGLDFIVHASGLVIRG